jgi:predicted DNA binding protein
MREMIVIADITVPASAFELGRLLEEFPNAGVELERIVPLRDTIISLFWVTGRETDEVLDSLTRSPLTAEAKFLTDDGNRQLFEVRWTSDVGRRTSDVDGLGTALVETEAKMLEGSSTGERWDFRLQFHNRDDLKRFRELAEASDIPTILRRLYNPNFPRDESVLSSEQAEVLMDAYEQGYFEVPRAVTVRELGDHFGISDNAVSQRLRRGLNTLVAGSIDV